MTDAAMATPRPLFPTLTDNQRRVLGLYARYSDPDAHRYMQYTAMLALCYLLMREGHLPGYADDILLYDYKDVRRHLWESKAFMVDVNILRDHDLLLRARVRTAEYRDINAHQCTPTGLAWLRAHHDLVAADRAAMRSLLECPRHATLLDVVLGDDLPRLKCPRCRHHVAIEGFLKDGHQTSTDGLVPFHLGGDRR
jgi:hypothetical protein